MEGKKYLDLAVLWDAKGARNVCKAQEGVGKLLEGHHALKIHTGLLLEEVGLIWKECKCCFLYLIISTPPLTERKVRRG